MFAPFSPIMIVGALVLPETSVGMIDDFRIGAVKLGMLANKEVIDAVADALEHHRPDCVPGDDEDVDDQPARP